MDSPPDLKCLISSAAIAARLDELGRTIQHDYADRELTVVGVLTGCFVMLADLIRRVDLPLRVGFVSASSYRGTATTPGELVCDTSSLKNVTGRDVLLVDDIFDTGQTLRGILEEVRRQQPRSIRLLVLLWKQGRSRVDFQPDYYGFSIPDQFVVGYGLDFDEQYRHLPYIAVLEPPDA